VERISLLMRRSAVIAGIRKLPLTLKCSHNLRPNLDKKPEHVAPAPPAAYPPPGYSAPQEAPPQ